MAWMQKLCEVYDHDITKTVGEGEKPLLPVGLLVAPGLWAVWASAAGVAQAANFVVIFTLVAQRYPTVRRGRQASATVQSVGYCLAAVAPTAAGARQTATGTWTAPVAVVRGALVVMTGIGLVLTGAPRRRAG